MKKGFLNNPKPNDTKGSVKVGGISRSREEDCIHHAAFLAIVASDQANAVEQEIGVKEGFNLIAAYMMVKYGTAKPSPSMFGFGTLITEDDIQGLFDLLPQFVDSMLAIANTFGLISPAKLFAQNTSECLNHLCSTENKLKELQKMLSERLPDSALNFTYTCYHCKRVHEVSRSIAQLRAQGAKVNENAVAQWISSNTMLTPKSVFKEASFESCRIMCAKYQAMLYARPNRDDNLEFQVGEKVGLNIATIAILRILNAEIDINSLFSGSGCFALLIDVISVAPHILEVIMQGKLIAGRTEFYSAVFKHFLSVFPLNGVKIGSEPFLNLMNSLSKPIPIDALRFSYKCRACDNVHKMEPNEDIPPDSTAFVCPPRATEGCIACTDISLMKMVLLARDKIDTSDRELMLGYNKLIIGCMDRAGVNIKLPKRYLFAPYISALISSENLCDDSYCELMHLTNAEAKAFPDLLHSFKTVYTLGEIYELARKAYNDWLPFIKTLARVGSKKFKEAVRLYPKPSMDYLQPLHECYSCGVKDCLYEESAVAKEAREHYETRPSQNIVPRFGRPGCYGCNTLALLQLMFHLRSYVDPKDCELMLAYNILIVTCMDLIDIDKIGGQTYMQSDFTAHPSVHHIDNLMKQIFDFTRNLLEENELLYNFETEWDQVICIGEKTIRYLAFNVLDTLVELLLQYKVEMNCPQFDELLKLFPKPNSDDLVFPFACPASCGFVHKAKGNHRESIFPKSATKKKVKNRKRTRKTGKAKPVLNKVTETTQKLKGELEIDKTSVSAADLLKLTSENEEMEKTLSDLKKSKTKLENRIKTCKENEVKLTTEVRGLEWAMEGSEEGRIDKSMETDQVKKKIAQIANERAQVTVKKVQTSQDLKISSLENKLKKSEIKAKSAEMNLQVEKDSHEALKLELENLASKNKLMQENSFKKYQDMISKEKADKELLKIQLDCLKEETEAINLKKTQAELTNTFFRKELERTENLKETNHREGTDSVQQLKLQLLAGKTRSINSQKNIINLVVNLRRFQMENAVQDIDRSISNIETQIANFYALQMMEYVAALNNCAAEFKRCKVLIERNFEKIVAKAGDLKDLIENGAGIDQVDPLPELLMPQLPPLPHLPPVRPPQAKMATSMDLNDTDFGDSPATSAPTASSSGPKSLPPSLQRPKLKRPSTQIQTRHQGNEMNGSPVTPTNRFNSELKHSMHQAIPQMNLRMDQSILEISLGIVESMKQRNPLMTNQTMLTRCLKLYANRVNNVNPPANHNANVPAPITIPNNDDPVVPVDVKPADLKDDDECVICLDYVQLSEDVVKCSFCNNGYYHLLCLERHLNESNTNGKCPTCRKRMISDRQFPALK